MAQAPDRRRVAENTKRDYLWQLGTHILPLLGAYRLNDISTQTLEEFKEHKLEERAHILAARQAGEVLRDRRGQPRRTLSSGSINKLLTVLTAILENAVRRDLIPSNPAASVERLRTRRSKGSILEAEELESLIEGAGDLTGRAGSTDIADRFRATRTTSASASSHPRCDVHSNSVSAEACRRSGSTSRPTRSHGPTSA